MTQRGDALTYVHNARCREMPAYAALAELALDLRWSWNRAADGVWRQLEPELWEETRNPWMVLQTVSPAKLQSLLESRDFCAQVEALLQTRKQLAEAPAWFSREHRESPLTCVAYLSMEFMLSEALPIYSGGLGNVAGDQLKSASDLGVPVVAVGLLYQQGYFRQHIDRDGNQHALYPYNDPGQLPITPLRHANGEWLRLEIPLPGYSMWVRAWQVQVGQRKLYLLDSNDPANYPVHRGITSELYGGGAELRLQQEMLLGIGGWRLLEALGLNPEVCHLNEGHAAFAILERARSFKRKTGLSFEAALAVTRAGNIFTTHTAVAAGFDCFAPALINQYLGRYATEKLGISVHDLLALGRRNAADSDEPFNMAYLAMRGSGAANGVSRLHGQVSRELFSPLFPRWPIDEVPISHVTNGIPTAWVAHMRASMAHLTPQFCTNRTVREYTELYYLPAARNYLARAAHRGADGAEILKVRGLFNEKWATVRFGDVHSNSSGEGHIFDAHVYLNDLDPAMVRVELFANALDGGGAMRREMKLIGKLTGATGGYAYRAQVSAARPAADYTARIIPNMAGVAVPMELGHIVWQK